MVSSTIDALKEEAVICEQLGTRGAYDIWKIIYVRKETKRSYDGALGHSRRDICLGEMYPLQLELLRSVGQE